MDYALLRFDEDLIQSSKDAGYEGKVAIACMNRDLTLENLAGEACWIAGWGSTSSTASNNHGPGACQKCKNFNALVLKTKFSHYMKIF